MERTFDLDGPYRALLAAVIRQAVRDAQAGRTCNGGCKGEAHVCAKDAMRFLRGPVCASLLDWLGLEDRRADLLAAASGQPMIHGKRRRVTR